MIMHVIGAMAEFERSLIRERTKAGLAEARKARRKLGRRFKLSKADRQQIVYLVREGKMTAADCARTYRIHESNVSRLLATAKAGLRRRLSLLVPRAAGLALLRLRNRIRPALVAGCWRRAVRR